MNKTMISLAMLLATSGVALAQNAAQNSGMNAAANAAQAGGNGMGGMMDPAERFKQMDKNNDGKLTQEEFTSGMQQMRGGQGGQGGAPGGGQGGGAQGGPPNGGQGGNGQNGGPPAGANGSGGMGGMMMDPAERFKAMDANKDGKVTKDEFTASMQQMQQMRGQQQTSTPAAQTKSTQTKK